MVIIKKRKPSVFLNRCCCLEVEVVFHCTGRNLSNNNNNNKLLKLGLKRFRCTFFIELYSQYCRFNPKAKESVFGFLCFLLRSGNICSCSHPPQLDTSYIRVVIWLRPSLQNVFWSVTNLLLVHSLCILAALTGSSKNGLTKWVKIRVVSFISHVQISSLRHEDVIMMIFISITESQESHFPRLAFSTGTLYFYIYVFCDFCIDVSAKKKGRMKGHCGFQHHNKQSNVATLNFTSNHYYKLGHRSRFHEAI